MIVLLQYRRGNQETILDVARAIESKDDDRLTIILTTGRRLAVTLSTLLEWYLILE